MTVKLLKQQHSCTKADESATTTHCRPGAIAGVHRAGATLLQVQVALE